MTNGFLHVVLRAMLWTVVCANLALTAAAGQIAVTASTTAPVNIPWDLAVMAFVISTFSGVAALLRRIDKELESNDGVLPRPVLFISMHLFGSWLAGITAFIFGQIAALDVWKELGLLVIASYAGAAALDFAMQTLAKRIDPNTPVEKLP